MRSICLAVSTLIGVASCAIVAQAEPLLPAGLGDPQPHTAEPALPAGMGASGGEDEWSDADESEWGDESPWDMGDEEAASPSLPFTGFWETRVGHRLQQAANQRQASLTEMRLELEKDFHLQSVTGKVSGDLVYDAIEEDHSVDLESGDGWFDLREAWLSTHLRDNVDIKAGRQILTWGVGDLIFINDLFPKDWNSFLAGRDEQFLKAPSDALRLGFYSGALNINIVYTPKFDSDRYIDGRRLSYFSPLYGAVVGQNAILEVNKPDDSFSDGEWALRAYRPVGSFEVALYGYRGFWKSPGGFDPATGKAVFPRLSVIGGSARGPVGPGILSAEAGYYHSADDSSGIDPLINNDEARALVGYEWEVMKDTTLALQYYVEVLDDYGNYSASLMPGQVKRDEYRQLATARLTRLALNQNLTLSLFIFYSPTDEDCYLRPKATYKVNDYWSVEGGMNLFKGQQDATFFGQFDDNSNLYAAVRYSF